MFLFHGALCCQKKIFDMQNVVLEFCGIAKNSHE